MNIKEFIDKYGLLSADTVLMVIKARAAVLDKLLAAGATRENIQAYDILQREYGDKRGFRFADNGPPHPFAVSAVEALLRAGIIRVVDGGYEWVEQGLPE